jgi:hypothetical protein
MLSFSSICLGEKAFLLARSSISIVNLHNFPLHLHFSYTENILLLAQLQHMKVLPALLRLSAFSDDPLLNLIFSSYV